MDDVTLPASRKLQRVFNAAFGIAILLGGTLGTGIIQQPGHVALELGSTTSALIMWLLGGVFAFAGSTCLIYLSAVYPLSGGPYVYVRAAFGPCVGFLAGWSDLIGLCAAMAYEARLSAEYVSALWTPIKHFEPAFACAVLLVFLLFQCAGVKWSEKVQQLTSAVTVTALTLLVVLCFLQAPAAVSSGPWPNHDHASHGWFLGGIFALQGVLLSYDGWQSPVYFAEEFRGGLAPIRKALLTGPWALVIVFGAINAALLHVLGPRNLALSGDRPIAAAAHVVFGRLGEKIAVCLLLPIMPAAINAASLLSSRVLFAMGRDGFFFPEVADVSSAGTPVPAAITACAIAILLVLTKSLSHIIDLAVSLFVLVYIGIFTATIRTLITGPLPTGGNGRFVSLCSTLALSIVLVYFFGSAATRTGGVFYALFLVSAGIPAYYLLRPRLK